MIGLGIQLARAAGLRRNLGLAAASAVVCLLATIAGTFVALGADRPPFLFVPLADPGTRGGFIVAVVLLAIAPLSLAGQIIRRGTAARERRRASMSLSGATVGQVRAVAVGEVLPAAVAGAAAGAPLFLLARGLVGSPDLSRFVGVDPSSLSPDQLRELGSLVTARHSYLPSTGVVPWWTCWLVAAAFTVALVAVAAMGAGRPPQLTAYGLVRREPVPVRRPYAALVTFAATLAVGVWVLGQPPVHLNTQLIGSLLVVLGVSSLAGMATWVVSRVARWVAERARRPAVALGAARLARDPRPTTRAGLVLGALGMAGAGTIVLGLSPSAVGTSGPSDAVGMGDVFAAGSLLAGGAVVVALVFVTMALVVRLDEAMLDDRRVLASLAALGLSRAELGRSYRAELLIVGLPLTALGAVSAAVPLTWGLAASYDGVNGLALLVNAVLAVVGVPGVVAVTVLAVTAGSGRWLRLATAPENLRV